MVVYAEYEIPADGFVIGRAFGRIPHVRVELDRVVPTVDEVIPFIWVEGADPDEVVRVTREYGAVEDITPLGTTDAAGALFRVVWRSQFRDAVVAIAETEATLLAGVGRPDAWRFEFRAPARRVFTELQSYLRSIEVPYTLRRITESDPSEPASPAGLTDAQRTALALAHERGYFDEPRAVKITDLARELDISRQATSGRLRRGIDHLVGEWVAAQRRRATDRSAVDER